MSKTHATDKEECDFYGHLHLMGHEPGTPLHEKGTVHQETQAILDQIGKVREAIDDMAHAPSGEVAGGPNPLQGDTVYRPARRERVDAVDYEGSDRKGLVTPPKRMPRW